MAAHDLPRIYNNGERIIPLAPGYREPWASHAALYDFALRAIPPASSIMDWGCGVGYGASLLAPLGCDYLGVDISSDAIAYARDTYGNFGRFVVGDVWGDDVPADADVVVCFECIEHCGVYHPTATLQRLFQYAPKVIFSVPYNEPRGANPHHTVYGITEETFVVGPWQIEWFYRQDDNQIVKQKPASCGNMIGIATL